MALWLCGIVNFASSRRKSTFNDPGHKNGQLTRVPQAHSVGSFPSSLVSPKRVVGCSGVGRYVEGVLGFLVSKFGSV